MSNEAQAPDTDGDEDFDPNWPKLQIELFQQHYVDLLRMRAELARLTFEVVNPNEREIFEVECKIDDSERQLMTTHAVYADHFWKKIAVFEHALHGTPDSDEDRIDNKKVWMFGCIKADLIALGVGGRKG